MDLMTGTKRRVRFRKTSNMNGTSHFDGPDLNTDNRMPGMRDDTDNIHSEVTGPEGDPVRPRSG